MEKFIDPELNQPLVFSLKPFHNTLHTFCKKPPPSSPYSVCPLAPSRVHGMVDALKMMAIWFIKLEMNKKQVENKEESRYWQSIKMFLDVQNLLCCIKVEGFGFCCVFFFLVVVLWKGFPFLNDEFFLE